MFYLPPPWQPKRRCLHRCDRYVQVIITAECAILPQNALGRPEHSEFVDGLIATVKEAYAARCKLQEEGEGASLDSGKALSKQR